MFLRKTAFPRQVGHILGTEACERFSYYGMRGILALYITGAAGSGVALSGLGMSGDAATLIIHAFIFGSYITGILGGWIADRFWGRYNTILRVSLLYCAGHGILALSEISPGHTHKTVCLSAGLLLIALGAGGIKPCVSSFMGDQFDGTDGEGASAPLQNPDSKVKNPIERAYAAFYWSINLGAVAAFIIVPWVRDSRGYAWAFAIPGVFMGIATLVFWLGRRHYVHTPLATGPGFWQIALFALLKKDRRDGDLFWDAARRRFGAEKVTDAADTLRAVRLFVFIPPFWALYDQNASTWVLQGRQLRPIDLGFATIGPDQMQAANPALIMVLVPLLTLLVYPLLGKFAAPVRRIGGGMVLAAFSFAIVGWLQTRIESGESLTLAWQLAPYLLLISGEVLVSVTGLELSYTLAPKSMKSTVSSLWFLTVAGGQVIVMLVTRLGSGAGDGAVTSGRFFLYAALLLATALLYAAAASRRLLNWI